MQVLLKSTWRNERQYVGLRLHLRTEKMGGSKQFEVVLTLQAISCPRDPRITVAKAQLHSDFTIIAKGL